MIVVATIDALQRRFTPAAASAWIAAAQQPDQFGHSWFGTEHVLLGVLTSPEEPTSRLLAVHGVQAEQIRARIRRAGGRPDDATLLASLGIDLDSIRQRVTATFGPDAIDRLYTRRRGWKRQRPAWGPLCGRRVAPLLKKALDATRTAADRRRSRHVDTRDLLIGLLSVDDMAVLLLRAEGVDTDELRVELEASDRP